MVKKPFPKISKKAKLLLITGLIFVCAWQARITTSSNLDINNGLIGYWNFDAGTGFKETDQSGNNNHGYIHHALRGVTGQVGNSLMLDGNDYVTMGDQESLDFNSEDSFSISAWVKLDDSIGDYKAIAGKASESSLDGYVLRHNTDGNLAMMIEENNGYYESNAVARKDYRDDQWHHLVGVINRLNDTNTIYVDGWQEDQVDISQIGDLTNNYHFNIGALDNGAVAFKGFIDEARVYQRALSTEEVQQIYNYQCQCSGISLNYPHGSLLQAADSYKVYYINKKGQKKWIINERVFNLYNNKWDNVIKVKSQALESYPTVNLVRAANDYKIFFIQGTTKQWIKTLEEFEQKGYQWKNIDVIKDEELIEYAGGQ